MVDPVLVARRLRLENERGYIDLAIESGDVLSIMPLVEKAKMEVDLVDLSSCDAAFAGFIRGFVVARRREDLG